MKKKYTWIAVVTAILSLLSAAAAVVVYLTMRKNNKKAKACEAAEELDALDDYDIDFLLDTDDDADTISELNLEDIAEYADDAE